jgi:drug/metabolite transporter (DMT)-like permease
MVFAMFAWGISSTNTKILSEYIRAEEIVFVRYFISMVSSFFIVILAKKSFKIDKKSLCIAFAAGLLTSIYTVTTFFGIKLGTAGVAGAFINTLAPINTFIILALFLKRKMYKIDIIALAIGFVGAILILGIWQFDKEKIFTTYNILFIISAWLWAMLTVVSSFSKKIDPLIFSFYMYLFVAILAFPFADLGSLNLLEKDSTFWINLLFMSIISTSVATSLYFIGVEKLGSVEVSSFMFITPLSSIFFGAVFLKEEIGFWTIVGTILSICAVYMINRIGVFKN